MASKYYQKMYFLLFPNLISKKKGHMFLHLKEYLIHLKYKIRKTVHLKLHLVFDMIYLIKIVKIHVINF